MHRGSLRTTSTSNATEILNIDVLIFCQVQSHGVADEVINDTVEAAKRFFALPEATKLEVGRLAFQ